MRAASHLSMALGCQCNTLDMAIEIRHVAGKEKLQTDSGAEAHLYTDRLKSRDEC